MNPDPNHVEAVFAAALADTFPQDAWRTLASPGRLRNASAALLGRPRLDRALGGDLDVAWAPAPAPLAAAPLTCH